MKANDVLECLRQRYCAPEWAFVEELSLIPGFIRGRRADAAAINCWTSGKWGLSFLGFEVKVSRSDFLHELKHPQKRLETYPDVDGIFFATPKGLVKKTEVPADCGLIECWVSDKDVYSTRIQKYPDGFKTPMEKMSHNASLNLNDAGPISRAVAVALIRAFDPRRINMDARNDVLRLSYEAKTAKSDARYQKEQAERYRIELEAIKAGNWMECPSCANEKFKGCKSCNFERWVRKDTGKPPTKEQA